MTHNLMHHKSSITKRRLIIIFILCTILTVSVMTGFSKGLSSDSTVYTADGERLVMWAELPDSGTPEDFDALDSLRFAAQKLYTSSYFKSESRGDVIANVGMGIKYSQHVHNVRVVKGNEIFQEAISSSALKSVADQLYFYGDNILYRPASKINGESATFSDTVYKLSDDEYYARYGAKPVEITKYAVNTDTVLEVTDGYAAVKQAANAETGDGEAENEPSEGTEIYVPEKLTQGADGNYCVVITLDPNESPKYYRNEVKTRGGADQYPVFYSVKLTLVMTSDFTPVSLKTDDNYDIAIPGLGAMNCTSSMIEYFSDFGADGEVPEREFFEKHFDANTGETPPDEQQKSPADYLSSAFSAYLDGSKDLDLCASVDIGGLDALGLDKLSIPELNLSVNIAAMAVRAKLGDLYIEYADDKVYITTDYIKGYFTVDAFKQAFAAEPVQKLLAGMGAGLPDFGALIGDDLLATVFENCEITVADGVACVRLPFSLGDITIDASLYINDDDMSLISISGTVKAFGLDISLTARPDSCDFPAVDATYSDLSGLAAFIPDAIETITGGAIKLEGSISALGTKIDFDLYADLTDFSAPIIDGNISALGLDISVKYVGGTAYLQLGNIKLKTTLSDVTELLPTITDLIGAELGSFDVKSLLPSDIDGWIAALRSLDATESTLDVSLALLGDISLSLARANGLLSNIALDANVALPDMIALDLSLDANISRAESRSVTAAGNYIDIKDLTPAIDAIKTILDKKSLSAEFAVSFGDMAVDGAIALDFADGFALSLAADMSGANIDLALIGDTIYIAVGEIKLSANTADINALIAALGDIVPPDVAQTLADVLGMLGGGSKPAAQSLDIADTAGAIVNAIEYLAVSDGALTARIDISGVALTAVIATDLSSARIDVSFGDSLLAVNLSDMTANAEIVGPDASDYVALGKFVELVKPVMALVEAEGYALGLSGDVLGIAVDGTLKIMRPTETTTLGLALDATLGDVRILLTLANGRLFVKLGDGIAVETGVSKDELNALVQKLTEAVPELAQLLDGMPKIEIDSAALTPANIVGAVTVFANTENGVKLALDGANLGIDISLACELTFTESGVKVSLGGNAFGISLDGAALSLDISDGALTGAGVCYSDKADVSLVIDELTAQTVAVPTDASAYVPLDKLADLVAPIYSLVRDAMTARAIGFDISATLLDENNNATDITGNITIALGESGGLDGINASLVLFAGTENATALDITFADNAVFVKLENILLTFDLDTDVDRLLDVLGDYLPDYLVAELGKLLGKVDGESAFAEALDIIGIVNSFANANGTLDIIRALFDTSKGNSALRTLLEAISLKTADDTVALVLDMMGMNFELVPKLGDGALKALALKANLSATLALFADVSELDISSSALVIPAPANAAEYVSVMDLVELANNLVHNFITPDADGNITFEISELDFDYSPKTVTDNDGKDVTPDRITVKNTAGNSALKGKIKPITVADADGNESTTFDFALEAHVDIDVESIADTFGTLTISLYVTDGAAHLDYYEHGTGSGERISLDFASVMQMLCAVLQIMDVDDEVIDSLAGNYKTDIDASFFKSMNIAGLDELKVMLEDLARTIESLKTALGEFNNAWDKIKNAGSIDNLMSEWNDTVAPDGGIVKGVKSSLLDALSVVIGLLPESGEPSDTDVPALIHGIAGGVTLEKDGENVIATIDNKLTVPDTQTDAPAVIEVAQSKRENGRILLDGVKISDLDVNTAMINASVKLFAGEAIDDIVLPADFKTSTDNTTYSDFSNIKRLVFDLMNTANLGEFEIGTGGGVTVDENRIYINLNIPALSGLIKAFGGKTDITIPYNIKVMLVDQGENANPRYNTAAVVEFNFDNVKMVGAVVIPNCTTRLYFYDNNFYIDGVRWYKDEYTYKSIFGKESQKIGDAVYERVLVKYTLDEFLGMFNDLPVFMERCLFYLLPLSIDFTFLGLDMQNIIIDAVKPKDDATQATATPTFATVFKGYDYTDGKHSVKIGLKEITGSSSLGDIDLAITGANDEDDAATGNLLNNYISALDLATNIQGDMVQVSLKAKLINVAATDDNSRVYSKGLSSISADGKQYRLYKTSSPAAESGYANDDIIGDYILNAEAVKWTPFGTVKGWAQYEDFDKVNKI